MTKIIKVIIVLVMEKEQIYKASVNRKEYLFKGDLDEIRHQLIQRQWSNFYPYINEKMVNDIRCFDRSCLDIKNDEPRDIVNLLGFDFIEEVQEDEEVKEEEVKEEENEEELKRLEEQYKKPYKKIK